MKVKTKYDGELDLTNYFDYLVDSVFRLLPMWEKNEDWKTYLTGFLIELNGLKRLTSEVAFISLISNLEGLFDLTSKSRFRKKVLDSITLIRKLEKAGE